MTTFNEESLPDTRPMILKLAEQRAGMAAKNKFAPYASLGRPRKGEKHYKEVLAQDSAFQNVLARSMGNQMQFSAFPMFLGYGMLSNLAQEALIRAGVETIADDMTRKPPELYYDDDGEDKEDLINQINSDMAKFKIKARINEAMQKDGYFGGCLGYIDVGDLEDDEAEEPLVLEKETFKKGSFRGLKIIEPVNIAPGDYNTTNPTDENYFNPEWYYVLGRRYHASRFLYFAGNETPLLLKPAYNFFGIPQAQIVLDYVANFVRNRESGQELLNKFSTTCFGTDLSQALQQDGSWADIINRMKAFNKFRTNNGTFVYNKETEEMTQINTPLSGVREIIEMSMNCLTAVWRIPKVRYLGEGDGGLNASTDGQLRSYYDYIYAMQEKVLTTPYDTIIKILQLNRGLEPDDKLLFKFPYLWEMDEKERAALNKTQADRDAIYLANGILSQEEVRQRLSLDRNSGYTMIDVDDVPEPQEQPLENTDKEEQDEEDRQAMDMALDEFIESEHPRDDDGRFSQKNEKLFIGHKLALEDLKKQAKKEASVLGVVKRLKENNDIAQFGEFAKGRESSVVWYWYNGGRKIQPTKEDVDSLVEENYKGYGDYKTYEELPDDVRYKFLLNEITQDSFIKKLKYVVFDSFKGHAGRSGFVGGSLPKGMINLTKDFKFIENSSAEIISTVLEDKFNYLIGHTPFNTKTEPFKIKLDKENKPHIEKSCVKLSKTQEKNHNAAILELEKIIENSEKYGEPEDVDLSHNTNKKTIKHKEKVEKYYTFVAKAAIGEHKFNIFLKAEQMKEEEKDILSLYNVRVKIISEPLT